MPVYTYLCGNCGAQFERKQSFDDPLLRKCPECGEQTLRKLFTPVGIHFKGPGFYSTDHGSGSRSNGSGKSEPKKEDSSAEKPSEPSSKPDKKPDKKSTGED